MRHVLWCFFVQGRRLVVLVRVYDPKYFFFLGNFFLLHVQCRVKTHHIIYSREESLKKKKKLKKTTKDDDRRRGEKG